MESRAENSNSELCNISHILNVGKNWEISQNVTEPPMHFVYCTSCTFSVKHCMLFSVSTYCFFMQNSIKCNIYIPSPQQIRSRRKANILISTRNRRQEFDMVGRKIKSEKIKIKSLSKSKRETAELVL